MTFETLKIEIQGSVAHVTLNRPQAKNAMNYKMMDEIYQVFTDWQDNREIRAVVLSGADGVFCAGGDIKEMQANTAPSSEQAGNLDNMLTAVNQASQVVIAKIEGVALGGGLGLVCVSDIAIASATAKIGLPEVRLGIAPSFISPYVIQRVGFTRARELMLTGRRFDGHKAFEYGFVHEVCEPEDLDNCVSAILKEINYSAPGAISAIKQLMFTVDGQPTENTAGYRAELLNQLRMSDEGQEGMLSFIQKRPAKWVK